MMFNNSIVKDIAYPLIKECFPNNDGISIRRDRETWDYYIEVHIPESDYIADLLSSDLDLDDIARQVEMELDKTYGFRGDRVFIKRKMSIKAWGSKTLKQLSLGC